MATTYHKSLDSILIIDTGQTTAHGWGSPKNLEATAAGSTTTIVASTVTADSNDDLVGYVVRCTDGPAANIGCTRRIVAYNDATNTLTVDKFPSATTDGDTFIVIDPGHVYLTADASDGAGRTISTGRSDTADVYNGSAATGGPYVNVINADNAVTTDFPLVLDMSDTGTFSTAAALTGSVIVGDLYEVWQCPEVMNGALFECTEELIERNAPTGDYGREASRAGVRSATGNIQLAFRGPGAGSEGGATESHRLLKSVLDYAADPGDLVVNGAGSTSSIPYDSGTAVVGRMYVTQEGSAFMCTAAGTPAVPSPNVDSTPADNSTVYGLATYTPSTGINELLAVKQHRGNGILEYIWGVAPAVSFSGTRNEFLHIDANCQGADWMRLVYDYAGVSIERDYQPVLATVDPVKLGDMRCVVDGTALGLRSFSFDPGQDIQPKINMTAPNEIDGYEIVGDNPTGTIEVFTDSNTIEALEDFLSGKEITILVQANKAPGFPGVFAIWAYKCRYTGPTLGDDAGQMTISLPFQVIRHSTSSLPRWALGIG